MINHTAGNLEGLFIFRCFKEALIRLQKYFLLTIPLYKNRASDHTLQQVHKTTPAHDQLTDTWCMMGTPLRQTLLLEK